MKKWFFVLAGLPVLLFSCNKSEENKCTYSEPAITAPANEVAYLQNYVSANSIPATQHPSGVFYTIQNPGSGAAPSVCSNITVNYTGALLPGGNVFDSNTSPSGVSFVLGQLIAGWQKVLPLLRIGGSMTMYIPPTLGYGAYDRTDGNGNVIIPANSYLRFTVDLLDVQ